MATRTRGYALRADIDAPPSTGVDGVDRAGVADPLAGSGSAHPGAKGRHYSATLATGLVREATIDIFEPPRRLRLMYLPPP